MEGFGHLGPMKTYPNMTIRWIPLKAGWDKPQLAVTGVMRDSKGTYVGALKADVHAANVGKFVARLGLRSRARGLCVDVATRVLLGISWNEPLVVLTPNVWFDFTLPDWIRMRYKTMLNVSDPLVRESAMRLSEDLIITAPVPFSRTIDTFNGPTYVDVVEVTATGLAIRVVLFMPEIDFLEEVKRTQGKTIGGVAGAIVFLIVVAFIMGHLMTAPFIRLRDRMYLTATLQDDGTVDPASMLSEVREMH